MSDPAGWGLTEEQVTERGAFYAVVGQAISIWADTETSIVRICARLLETDEEKAGLVLFSLNFVAWLPLITELFKSSKKHQRLKKKWNKQEEQLKILNDLRVRLAHHTSWESRGTEPIALKPSRLDTRPRSKAYKPLTANEISNQFTEPVYEIGNKLFALIDAMDGRQSLPRKPSAPRRDQGQRETH